MKKRVNRLISMLLVMALIIGSLAGYQKPVEAGISTSGSSSDFPIVANGTAATIWVDSSEETPVKRVVNDLKADVNRVTGKTPTVSNASSLPSGPVILVGTLNKSAQIKNLINSGAITTAEVNSIKGKWEAYLIKVINNKTMVILGSDNRGAIYGVYEVSEQMGVSPWYYFADVPIQTKTNVYMPAGTSTIDMPDVQYRGIFINDEEKLNAWVKNKFNPENGGSGSMGAAIYARIFELILRLKGNYIWPAMHVNYFDNIPENITTIREYGVVLRKTVSAGDEWSSFKKTYAANNGLDASTLQYDYTVNPAVVQAFWRQNIEKHKDSDVQWLLGMRGEGDEPFNYANLSDSKWDKYGTTSEGRRAGLLSEIIADQIKLLEEILGKEKANAACKAILPYKEVLQLYNNPNFTVPEDFTIIWCDENHGTVRRLPTAEDRQKYTGGIYYHASYWAPANQSYMWMSSIPLSVMGEELNKCWEGGIRKIWVLNVGDIKPLEGEMDYFIRCGWDVEKYTTDSVGFYEEWMKRNFGDTMSDSTAKEVADILNTFYHHTNVRKVEHMAVGVFEQINYNEWDKRMAVYTDLYYRARTVANSMTSAQKIAFYELIQCKINWTYLTYKMYYYADKSNLAYDMGKMAAAQNYSDLSIKVELQRKDEIEYYSTMNNGKWDGLIDPEVHSPPVTTQLPETNPTIILGKTEMGIVVQGEEKPTDRKSTLSFNVYNQDGKFVDIFNKGAGNFTWTATVDKDWVKLSATTGNVKDEQRIFVTIKDYAKAAGDTATITIEANGKIKKIKVKVDKVPEGITNCYVESDGYVSMQVEHYTSKNDAAGMTWRVIEEAGRAFDGDMMQAFDPALGLVSESNINASTSPSLSYDFYLTSEGQFPMEIYRLPSMNAVPDGKLRFAYSIDNGAPVIVSSTAVDEGTTSNQNKQWVKNIFGGIEKHVVTLPNLTSGKHTLKLWMVDNFITLDKMVIYTTGEVTTSALGPDESYHSAYNNTFDASTSQMTRTITELSEKNTTASWGSGAFIESAGKVSIEAEYAMENVLADKSEIKSNMYAYTVSKAAKASEVSGRVANEWRLTQSDTGLAMRVPDLGSGWSTAAQFPTYSPELSYKIKFATTGTYKVWLRWRFIDNASDSIRGGLDNVYTDGQFTGSGGFHSYGKDEKWYWQQVASMDVATTGEHLLNLWVREDGLMVDKIYMTTGTETPTDSSFTKSSRTGTAAKTAFQQTIEERVALLNNNSYPLGDELGSYDPIAYYAFIAKVNEVVELAYSGNVTDASAQTALAELDAAEKALKDSQVLSNYSVQYNAFRDFEEDEIGKYPYGFDAWALTNGATALVEEENGNKYISVRTTETSGKANVFLPYTGNTTTGAGEKIIVEFDARFIGTFKYANGAMVQNDQEKYSMVAAFENSNQASEIRIQNAGTKTKVQNFVNGQWHSFKMVADFATNTYTTYIDNVEVATNFTFRDTTGTKLTGQLFGIDGFANGRVDYDNFAVRIAGSSYGNILDAVNEERASLTKHSYPLGHTVGCYSSEAYNNLVSTLNNIEALAKVTTLTESNVETMLREIAEAKAKLDQSLILVDGSEQVYNAYRDFENDTLGALIPYGIDATRVSDGGAVTIVEENGNKFLRLTTDSDGGYANMYLPYANVVTANPNQNVVVEFSARFNEGLRYANAFLATNQMDSSATTIAFDNTGGAHKVLLKKSGSSSLTAAYFEYDTWHDYKVVINMTDQCYSVYMDGELGLADYPFRTMGTEVLRGHVFGIDGFGNGQVDFDDFIVKVVEDEDTETIPATDGIEINGYQISYTADGMRTVYSVESKINGLSVVSSGIVYSLSDYVDETELYVGSDSEYVKSFASTTEGKFEKAFIDSETASSYAMTMKFGPKTAEEFKAGWRIRAYAQLEDGTYVYSKAYKYTIFDIADKLYQNVMMPSFARHNYLYTDILSVVDSNYTIKNFDWSIPIVGVK